MPHVSDALAELSEALPRPSDAASGEDLAYRARAALSILIEHIKSPCDFAAVKEDPTTCPNCGVPVSSRTSPYCGDCCREQAAFIRQMRDRISNGTLLESQSQMMKGEQMWRLLGGGLPRRLALVPESSRKRVFKRSEGKCELCGAPATVIDNIGGG